MKSNTTPVTTRLTITEVATIQTEIRKGRAINPSDFVRQAVREKIERIESSS